MRVMLLHGDVSVNEIPFPRPGPISHGLDVHFNRRLFLFLFSMLVLLVTCCLK